MDYYMLWNGRDKVDEALRAYTSRYGQPPNIIQSSVRDDPLPENMGVVVERVHIPTNYLLVGILHLGEE